MRSLQGEVKNVAGGGEMSEPATANKPQHENDFVQVQADYNSNRPAVQAFNSEIATKAGGGGQKTSVETSHMSTTSSNDEESLTTTDVSDYQWFPDYVDGDSINATSMRQSQQRPSIFSSLLNYSSNIQDINYEAISRNIDANLAEIDMEDFRSEDINSILAIPNMYSTNEMGGGDFHSSGSHGEQAASLSASIMAHFDDDFNDPGSNATSVNYQHQQLSISITSDSTDMSVCKSEQLFSPMKETESLTACNGRRHVPHALSGDPEGASAAPHLTTFSIDSLDCDSYDEQELILTCQTNVDNYTIAFEGSLSRDSEDSDYHDEAVVCETSDTESWTNSNHRQPLPHFKLRNSDSVDGSLVQSDFVYTTWTKLRHLSPTGCQKYQKQRQQQRHPRPSSVNSNSTSGTCNKSQSLPNLSRKSNLASSLQISQLNVSTNGSLILGESQRCIPLYDVTSSINSPSSSSQSLSLMRLFMQNRATSSSSCTSSTGPIGSITHSMSSGTLQHQTDFLSLQSDSNISDRLQCFLNTKLSNNNGEQDMAVDPQLSPSNHAFKRRPVSPISSPIEEVDESENTTTTSNKYTQNTIKNKNSDDSIEENSANELEMDAVKTGATGGIFNELTQGTQTSGNNVSGNNNSNSNAMIYITNNNIQRGDSGVSLSSGCTSYGERKTEKRSSPRHQSHKPNSNSSVTITMFATRGTQLPVHVCDEAIQTSNKGEWRERIISKCSNSAIQLSNINDDENDVEKDNMEETKSESTSRPATIYVCYPNYSLPDLGFLNDLKSDEFNAEVKLSPKKAIPPKKPTIRPKSCPGLEHLQPNMTADLARIRDWDSLNVLLPKEVKEMLRGLRATEIVDQPFTCGKENMKDTPLYVYQCNPNHEQIKNLIPKGILRRAKTDPSSEIKNLNTCISNPSTPKKFNKQVNVAGENVAINIEQAASCKCPVSAELTALLGISMDDCDCENISDSTFEQLCSVNAEIDPQDDLKNKKAVSFSSRQGTCSNNEPQTDNIDRFSIKNNEMKDKDWSLLIETSEDRDEPPREFFVSPTKDSCDLPSEQTFPLQPRIPVPSYGFTAKNCGSTSWEKKQDLVNAVDVAVKALNSHFSQARDPHTKFLTGSSLHTPSTGYKVHQLLCPALFNILNDGLQPSVYNIFGHMDNSVWMVVETLTQAGNCTKQMSDLVVHVNNEQRISDKRTKFNAFACGLLNIRSLATWFSLLGSSQNLLHKHYSPSAFLQISTSSMKYLFDELLISLQTLSLLPFDLDLSLELQISQKQMSDLTLNITQYQSQQPHRICLSSSPSKSKPQEKSVNHAEGNPQNSKHSGSPKLVHRHSCGLLIDESANHSSVEDSDDDTGEKKSQRLRRGLSQDSAIDTAKNSSEYIQDKLNNIPAGSVRSTEEHREGWALKDLPKRPWSYAQEAELEFNSSSQNSSKETCSSSGGGSNTGDNSSASSGSKEVKQIVTRGRRNNLSPNRVYDEGETVVITTENIDRLLVTDAEKGSLDAKIAERRRLNDVCEPKTTLNDKEHSSEEVDGVQFKELQKRWEILSGAPTSCAEVDRKKIVNSNSRSKIPRLVMPLPNSPSPKLKRQVREANEELLLPQPTVQVVSSSAQNAAGVVVQTPTNRSSSGANNLNKVVTPSLVAKNTQIASPEKSPVKKPNTSTSRVHSAAAATKSKQRGTTKGASGGLADDTTN